MSATMWLSRCKPSPFVYRRSVNTFFKRLMTIQIATQDDSDHGDVVYPPIKPRFPTGHWGDMEEKIAWQWQDKMDHISKIPTVTERLKYLTERKYRVWMFPPLQHQPGVFSFQQSVTKTHLIEGLPDIYKTIDVDAVCEQLKPLVVDAILLEHDKLFRDNLQRKTWEVKRELTENVLRQIIFAAISILSEKYEHLRQAPVDENVRVEAFWDRYGLHRFKRTSDPLTQQKNVRFQSRHVSDFQIRIEKPLPEFLAIDDQNCMEGYPGLDYWPGLMGQFGQTVEQSCIAGHWAGDPCEFGLLTVLNTAKYPLQRFEDQFGHKNTKVNRLGYGLASSFVWLVAQAHYQGFNTFLDTTYPLTTQTVLTDGQTFSFLTYQLNTLHLWKSNEANPVGNVCWHSEETKLYEEIENGEVEGFNDQVLQQLIKCFVLQPVDRGIDLRPTLPKEPSPSLATGYINEKVEEIIEEEEIQYDMT